MRNKSLHGIVLIVLGYFIVNSFELNSLDGDMARFIKHGESMIQNGSLYINEGFSYGQYAENRLCYEIFTCIFFYISYSFLGTVGLHLLLHVVGFCGLFFFVRSFYRSNSVFNLAFGLVLSLPFLLSIPTFSYHYLQIGVIGFFLGLLIRGVEVGECKGIFFLPLLAIIWTNISVIAVFVVPPVMLLYSFARYRAGTNGWKSIFISVLTILFVLASPVFFTLHDIGLMDHLAKETYTIGSLSLMDGLYSEHPFSLALPVSWSLTIVYTFLLFVLTPSKKGIDFVLFSVLLVSSLLAGLLLQLAFLLGIPLLYFTIRYFADESPSTKYMRFASLYIVIPAIFWLTTQKYVDKQAHPIGLGCDDQDLELVQFIQQNGVKGPVFNNIQSAGLIIHYLLPYMYPLIYNNPISLDDEFLASNYFPKVMDREVWHTLKSKYQINAILFNLKDATLDQQHFLGNRLDDGEWKLVLEQKGKLVLLLRNNELNRNIIIRHSKF